MVESGNVFQYLTVMKLDDCKSKPKRRYWICKCVCGTEKSIREDSLLSGKTISCGCYKKSKEFSNKLQTNHPIENLTGQTFHEIFVLGLSDKRQNKKIMWKCLCSCGAVKDFWSANLKNGTTKTCGAAIHKSKQIEERRKSLLKDLSGKQFGEWTVIKWDEFSSNPTRWICKCSCGKIDSIIGASLKNGSSTSCGHKTEHDLVGEKIGHWTVLFKTKRKRPNGHCCSVYYCKCDCGNSRFVDESRLLNQTSLSCGCVNSKGNEIIASILNDIGVDFKTEYSFKDLVGPNKGLLRFDFALFNDDKLIALIEYQGEQHYKDIEFGKMQREITDNQKKEYCKNHNIQLYEISYKENINISLFNLINKIYANPVPSS